MKEKITKLISEIIENDSGFDIYVTIKNESMIKRLVLEEGKPHEAGGFKGKIKHSIIDTIKARFLSDESVYLEGVNLADDQHSFYLIHSQNDSQGRM